jgi:hypothetical protein
MQYEQIIGFCLVNFRSAQLAVLSCIGGVLVDISHPPICAAGSAMVASKLHFLPVRR